MMLETNKKSKIPYLFFIFFAIIFVIDGIYIYLAKKSWRGLATEDGYKKGLKYNETIELVKKQKELSWNSKIKFEILDNSRGNLYFTLLDKSSTPIKDSLVIAKISRPVQEGYDFKVPLKYDAKNKSYLAKVDFPLKGQWNIEIQASLNDKVYQDVKRVVIQ